MIAPSCSSAGLVTILLVSQSVGTAGGTVSVTDPSSPLVGTEIIIPPGALSGTTTVTISQVVSGGPYASDVLDVEFGPAGTTLAIPATVTIKYQQQYLTDNGIADPATLRVVESSPSLAPETLATSSQDTVNHTISAQITRFGSFAALAPTKASLSGSYFLITYSWSIASVQGLMPNPGIDLPAPLGNASEFGAVLFDGIGGLTYSTTQNTDGSISPNSGSATYSVASDGTFTSGPNQGGVLAGGEIAIAASTSGDPKIFVYVKQGGTSTNASLSGPYFMIARQFNLTAVQPVAPSPGNNLPTPRGYTSETGTVTFDGSGGLTLSSTQNADGSVTSGSGSTSYSVAAGGGLSFGPNQGVVLAGGQMALAASGSSDPKITIFTKKAGTFTNASLSGSYFFIASQHQNTAVQPLAPAVGANLPTPQGNVSTTGRVTFDGSGGLSFSSTQDTDGSATPNSGSGSYSVASDGTFTFGFHTGGVLLGGRVAIAASTSGDPKIFMLLR